LFSRVMREGLSTGNGARKPGSGLSGAIFSRPHDCVDLVNFLQVIVKKQKILVSESAWIGVAIASGATGIEASQVIAGTVLCFWNSLTDISFARGEPLTNHKRICQIMKNQAHRGTLCHREGHQPPATVERWAGPPVWRTRCALSKTCTNG
jgi:hypothetical protein